MLACKEVYSPKVYFPKCIFPKSFSQSVYPQSLFFQSVFFQSVFFQSVLIQSVFLRNVPDLCLSSKLCEFIFEWGVPKRWQGVLSFGKNFQIIPFRPPWMNLETVKCQTHVSCNWCHLAGLTFWSGPHNSAESAKMRKLTNSANR